jgi:pimeloyl-ACP methyl ester carboxylesterase
MGVASWRPGKDPTMLGTMFSPLRLATLVAGPIAAAKIHSHYFVDHAVPLPSALDAERSELDTKDAGTLNYYSDTTAKGRPLVLVHGIHAAASAFDVKPLFDGLRGRRRVYALDLPGFGFSTRGPNVYSPELYVSALRAFIAHVAPEGADVIALSLSGEYAAKLASEADGLVSSLVLVSPTGFTSPGKRPRGERRARSGRRKQLALLRRMVGDQALFDLLVSRTSIRYYLNKTFYGPVPERLAEYQFQTSHQWGATHAPLAFVDGDLFPGGDPLETYARVSVPTLVIFDEDGFIGFGALRPFVESHANFSIHRVFPTCGLPHFEQPTATLSAIQEFWSGLPSPELGGERRKLHDASRRASS